MVGLAHQREAPMHKVGAALCVLVSLSEKVAREIDRILADLADRNEKPVGYRVFSCVLEDEGFRI